MVVIATFEAVIISSSITGVIICVFQHHPVSVQVLVVIKPKILIQNIMYALYLGALRALYAQNLYFLDATLNIIKKH